jgi:GH25 family lysozyme M1 (1,4-beta-N-acetylmuramidase)
MQPRQRARASSLLTAAALAVATLATTALGATPAVAATSCVYGPDISGWQHPNGATINWDKVAAACNSFAIVKATEGSSYTNPYFASDWIGAGAAGLIRGAYHFARPALPMSTATQQADRFAAVVGSMRYSGTLPPILDLEENGGLSAASLITWTQTFLDEVQRKTGRTPAVYTYRFFWSESMASTSALRRYPLWIADYTSGATEPHSPLIGSWSDWALWQYTAAASVPGISGQVDRSRFNGTMTDLTTFADGAHASTLAVRTPAAPLDPYASLSGTSATVSWLPADNGGSLVSTYTVTATPGGATTTVSGASHVATVTGLQPGTSYQFSVRAHTAAGLTSAASALSNAVSTYVPVSLTTSGATRVPYGGSTTVTATMRRADTGAVMTGWRVYVATRPAGSSTWTMIASTRTASDGTVRVPLTPPTNESVRFRFFGRYGYTSASTIRAITVKPIVTAHLSSTTVRAGGKVTLTGSVSPVLSGATVYRDGYYDGAWHTWATTTVSKTGTFSFTISPTVKTTDIYRARVGSTSKFGSSSSPRMSLTVS